MTITVAPRTVQAARVSVKILCVNGSENANGSTAQVLERFSMLVRAQGLDVEIVTLADFNISPCGPCGNCNWRLDRCAVPDDVEHLVSRLVDADGIVYAAPVHAFGLASRLQIFIERAGVGFLRFNRPLANKIGGVIVVGRKYAHTSVVGQIHHNMLLNRMIVPGSGYPAVVSTESGDPFDDAEGMSAVEALALRISEVTSAVGSILSKTSSLPINERIG